MANIKAKASQVTPVTTGEADLDYAKMSKLGALFTADWKQQLIAAGLAWSAHVGGITASADILAVVGGGADTTIDTDQPELVIGVTAGYYLIPMEAHVSCYADPVTDNAITNIVLFADRTQAPVEAATSCTTVTPNNLLDGSINFPGTCYKACSANLTSDPECTELLDYVGDQLGAASTGTTHLSVKMDYMPQAESRIAGPCQIVLCWGGTAAASGMGVVKFACVPTSYYPTT